MSTSQRAAAERQPAWGAGWGVGLRVWVERAGRAVLGEGRLELLEGIQRHRSISAAGRATGIPYRRAWELVQGMNEAAGEPLVATATGGVHGGGALGRGEGLGRPPARLAGAGRSAGPRA